MTMQEGTAPRSLTTAPSRLLPLIPLWTSAWTPPTSTEMFFEDPDEAKCGGNLVFQLVNTVAPVVVKVIAMITYHGAYFSLDEIQSRVMFDDLEKNSPSTASSHSLLTTVKTFLIFL